MNAAQIFARAGQALFGSGQDWKSQFGAALMVKPDTIDAMTKGKSRQVGIKNAMFCAERAWDQHTESIFMKRIEDKFQEIVQPFLLPA